MFETSASDAYLPRSCRTHSRAQNEVQIMHNLANIILGLTVAESEAPAGTMGVSSNADET
jgi:hypothetical protein